MRTQQEPGLGLGSSWTPADVVGSAKDRRENDFTPGTSEREQTLGNIPRAIKLENSRKVAGGKFLAVSERRLKDQARCGATDGKEALNPAMGPQCQPRAVSQSASLEGLMRQKEKHSQHPLSPQTFNGLLLRVHCFSCWS